MGIVNATPDSFSDRQGPKDLDELTRLAEAQSADGAAIVDVGGESGRTDTEVVSVEEEIARVRPLVERLAAGGMTVSVDTWRAPVARAVLEAGAAMINDVSGLSDERLAVECAEARAALVITHTRASEGEGVPHYEDVVADVVEFLREREGWRARTAWPGSRSCSTRDRPGQDARRVGGAAARLDRLAALGRPLLVAVSRKDFIGVLTERPPAARDAGTLAAVGAALRRGARILRVHDVAAARYLRVHAALEGERAMEAGARLEGHLMREHA